jgi:hypothetical protein
MTPHPRPSLGRIVHYVLAPVDCEQMAGKSRPGIVVLAHDDRLESVNLQVLTNGGHDHLPAVHWKREVAHDEGRKPGTWHWPPPAHDSFQKQAETLGELKRQLEVSRERDKAVAIEAEIASRAVNDVEQEEIPFPDTQRPDR